MRLVLVALGRVVVDLRVLEAEEDDDEPDDVTGSGNAALSAHVTQADRYPLGFTFEPAPDRWPWDD